MIEDTVEIMAMQCYLAAVKSAVERGEEVTFTPTEKDVEYFQAAVDAMREKAMRDDDRK